MKTKQTIIVSLMVCYGLILNLFKLSFASGIIVYCLFKPLLDKSSKVYYHIFLFFSVINKALNYWFKYQPLFINASITTVFLPLTIIFIMIFYYALSLLFELVALNFIFRRIGLKTRVLVLAKRFFE